ncbi:hypothetical protein M3Y94_00649200 [Aphelenchoides besseyi]|nr:hypothetical protein M3Y94_00649200 [Aphelenchoides besseyi]
MSATRSSEIVSTTSGPVRGKTFEFGDQSASAFLGIPYAKPPINELRFKKPQPVESWTEVRSCVQFAAACPHISPNTGHNLHYDEDCLYLNVFAPPIERDNLKPVLFYIHGGGFIVDSSELIGDEGVCKFLCSKGIVVVTFNYRLGIFGFLTLDNDEVKGNFGMFDMLSAMQWTRDNIRFFGGDRDRITIAGQSAGGVAVDLFTLSPLTRDIFAQAIIFAGTTYGIWFDMNVKESRSIMIEYAKYRGCVVDGRTDEEVNQQVLNFYRNKSADELKAGIFPDPNFKFCPNKCLPLVPQIDGDFFPKSLDKLRKEAPPKRIINGVTEHEGLLFCVAKALKPELSYKDHTLELLSSTRPHFTRQFAEKCVHEAAEGHVTDDHEHSAKCIQLVSDFMFNESARRFGIERTKLGDRVYNFVFSHYKPGTLGELGKMLPFEGSTHCCELPYFFGKSILGPFKVEAEDQPVIDRFTTYLCSFIRTGDPNNEKYAEVWKPVTLEAPDLYFEFTSNGAETRDNFCGGKRLDVWDRLFSSQ